MDRSLRPEGRGGPLPTSSLRLSARLDPLLHNSRPRAPLTSAVGGAFRFSAGIGHRASRKNRIRRSRSFPMRDARRPMPDKKSPSPTAQPTGLGLAFAEEVSGVGGQAGVGVDVSRG